MNMTLCWSNPITTISGGIGETYGINLLRIDLTEDYVLYDRNQDKYFQYGEEIMPHSRQRKGVDTEVVYGLYHLFGEDQFQEYAIHSSKVIKSWSFDDEELILEWHTNIDFYFNDRGELPMEDWHFLKFDCTNIKSIKKFYF